MASKSTRYYGAVINPNERDAKKPISYDALTSCLIEVSDTGKIITFRRNPDNIPTASDGSNVVLKPGEFIMPGFVDTHTHAPQFPNLGIGQEYQLLEWLDKVTYPMEAKFSESDFAERTYKSVVRNIIDFGTTTCCYYGTIHLGATKLLADIVLKFGQRAFIGKCNMDREVPENNREETQVSIDNTKKLIEYIDSLPQNTQPGSPPLIHPIITPRFAISCTPELLKGLSKLAENPPRYIQTHISENFNEIAKVGELFPGNTSYADVYKSFNLLGPKTILAHGVHLGDDEVKIIKETKAGISHCPTSNFNLSSGIAPVGKYLDAGIKVGLGTDVSGGFNPSILNTIQHASIASKIIAFQHEPSEPLKPGYNNRKFSVATLLYLATLGGAHVCDLDAHIGSFAVGKTFDALLVNMGSEANNPGSWPTDPVNEKELRESLERFLFCGDDRNISKVYVQGKLIGGKDWSSPTA